MKMPKIELKILHEVLGSDIYSFVRRIADEKTWRVRRTRPTITRDSNGQITAHCACATYIWRMVVFTISPFIHHKIMLVSAYSYLPKTPDSEIKELVTQLNEIVTLIVDTVPVSQWYGVQHYQGDNDV
jgi:hypothetical protein